MRGTMKAPAKEAGVNLEEGTPMTRQRGIMVQPVDWTGYLPYKSAVATDGTYTYVICTEGVGRRIDEDEVARMTTEGEPVDLADWIRTFGSRLEVNFQLWADKLRDEQWEELCPACGDPLAETSGEMRHDQDSICRSWGTEDAVSEIDVTECPDCAQKGSYDARVKVGGRGIYTCPDGHRWQDADETPSEKGYIPLDGRQHEHHGDADNCDACRDLW